MTIILIPPEAGEGNRTRLMVPFGISPYFSISPPAYPSPLEGGWWGDLNFGFGFEEFLWDFGFIKDGLWEGPSSF